MHLNITFLLNSSLRVEKHVKNTSMWLSCSEIWRVSLHKWLVFYIRKLVGRVRKLFLGFILTKATRCRSFVEFRTVCVLPAPVWPYARMVPLYPSMTDLTTSWDQRHVNSTSKSPKDLGTHTEAQISKICSWLPLDRTSPWLRWEPAVGKCQMTVIGNVRCLMNRVPKMPNWTAEKVCLCIFIPALSSLKCQVSCWLFTFSRYNFATDLWLIVTSDWLNPKRTRRYVTE